MWILACCLWALSPLTVAGETAAAAEAVNPTAALIDELVGMKDHAARRERLTRELVARATDPDLVGRYGQAIAVVEHLEKTGRPDPTVTRLFLTAVLLGDEATRSQAVTAAEQAGDPPLVASAAALAGLAGLARVEPLPDLPDTDDPSRDAVEQARNDIIRSNEIRTGTGGTMLTVGSIGVLVGVVIPPFTEAGLRKYPTVYTQKTAQSWTGRHNAKLRDDLGLSEEDTQKIDLK